MLVGIDVAKAELVVAVRPSGERWTVANDERGVRKPPTGWRRPALCYLAAMMSSASVLYASSRVASSAARRLRNAASMCWYAMLPSVTRLGAGDISTESMIACATLAGSPRKPD